MNKTFLAAIGIFAISLYALFESFQSPAQSGTYIVQAFTALTLLLSFIIIYYQVKRKKS